ncbi:hypothetical protein [Salinarchaeum laminariae]|uniref:hypothetical protein n=1 Tax=Salinarchaeum laminariae TaxID=869888 RepID=UPI0020C0053F|nr:hypothetical protein [Salinarchaeum laminariae]
MAEQGSIVGDIAGNLIAAALMIFLAVLSFFVTVFVVDAGASLAGYDNNPYVVQSAAILAGSAIIAGGIAPIGALSGMGSDDRRDPLE